MAATATFGAAIGTDSLTQAVEIEQTTETAVWKNNVGVDTKVKAFNPMTKGSFTLGGVDSSISVGVVSSVPITGISGGVITIPSVKTSYKTDGGAEQVVTFEHRPSGSALT